MVQLDKPAYSTLLPIKRIIVFGGLYWGTLIAGNYHVTSLGLFNMSVCITQSEHGLLVSDLATLVSDTNIGVCWGWKKKIQNHTDMDHEIGTGV